MSVIQIENKAINEETEIYNFIKKLNRERERTWVTRQEAETSCGLLVLDPKQSIKVPLFKNKCLQCLYSICESCREIRVTQMKITQLGSESSGGRIIKTGFTIVQKGPTGFYLGKNLSNAAKEISDGRNCRRQTLQQYIT